MATIAMCCSCGKYFEPSPEDVEAWASSGSETEPDWWCWDCAGALLDWALSVGDECADT